MKLFLTLCVLFAVAPSLADEAAACRIKIDDALKACDSTGDKRIRAALESARHDANPGSQSKLKSQPTPKEPQADNVRRTRVYRGTTSD